MTEIKDQAEKYRRRFYDKPDWYPVDLALKAISYEICHPNKNKLTWACEKVLIHFVLRATKKGKKFDINETRWESRQAIADLLRVEKDQIVYAEKRLRCLGLVKTQPVYERGEKVGRSIALSESAIATIKKFNLGSAKLEYNGGVTKRQVAIDEGGVRYETPNLGYETPNVVVPNTQPWVNDTPMVRYETPNVGYETPIESKTMETKTKEPRINERGSASGVPAIQFEPRISSLDPDLPPGYKPDPCKYRDAIQKLKAVETIMKDLIQGKDFVDFAELNPIYRLINVEYTPDQLKPFVAWYVENTLGCDYGQIRKKVTEIVYNERNGESPNPFDFILYIRNQYNKMVADKSK